MSRLKRIRDGAAKILDMNRYSIMLPLAVSAGYTLAAAASAAISGDMGNFSVKFDPEYLLGFSLLSEYVGYRTDMKRFEQKLDQNRKNVR
jgi:hypothetical protein